MLSYYLRIEESDTRIRSVFMGVLIESLPSLFSSRSQFSLFFFYFFFFFSDSLFFFFLLVAYRLSVYLVNTSVCLCVQLCVCVFAGQQILQETVVAVFFFLKDLFLFFFYLLESDVFAHTHVPVECTSASVNSSLICFFFFCERTYVLSGLHS